MKMKKSFYRTAAMVLCMIMLGSSMVQARLRENYGGYLLKADLIYDSIADAKADGVELIETSSDKPIAPDVAAYGLKFYTGGNITAEEIADPAIRVPLPKKSEGIYSVEMSVQIITPDIQPAMRIALEDSGKAISNIRRDIYGQYVPEAKNSDLAVGVGSTAYRFRRTPVVIKFVTDFDQKKQSIYVKGQQSNNTETDRELLQEFTPMLLNSDFVSGEAVAVDSLSIYMLGSGSGKGYTTANKSQYAVNYVYAYEGTEPFESPDMRMQYAKVYEDTFGESTTGYTMSGSEADAQLTFEADGVKLSRLTSDGAAVSLVKTAPTVGQADGYTLGGKTRIDLSYQIATDKKVYLYMYMNNGEIVYQEELKNPPLADNNYVGFRGTSSKLKAFPISANGGNREISLEIDFDNGNFTASLDGQTVSDDFNHTTAKDFQKFTIEVRGADKSDVDSYIKVKKFEIYKEKYMGASVYDVAGENTDLSASVRGYFEEEQAVTVIFAKYDVASCLKETKVLPKVLIPGEIQQVQATFEEALEEGDTYKIFVWSADGTLTPWGMYAQ